MKNRKCPCRGHCWDYGDCENCDIGKAIAGLQKKVDRLKQKNKKLEAELNGLKEQLNEREATE